MKKRSRVGKEVLEVYRKASPSAISIESRDYYNKLFGWQKELWQGRLKIPLSALSGAKVFDFGCGTGEIDVFLARNKAVVAGADFNPDSISRARQLAGHFALNSRLTFKVADIHNRIFPQRRGDFVISLGVLPHVQDPAKVFRNMIRASKPGGFIVVGFVEELGIVQRLLHRSIIRAIAGLDEKKIMEIARQAFPDHIRRSVRFGLRTERSVVFDYLVNRHMYGLPLENVIGWFKEEGVSYYSSWPSIELPLEINPYTSERIDFMHPLWKEYRALLRLRWLFSQHEDAGVFGSLLEAPGCRTLARNVDSLSSLLAGLVQNQKNDWQEDDLSSVRDASRMIIRHFDSRLLGLHKALQSELTGRLKDLDKVLSRIVKLQRRESENFKIGVNLFRELNGLGTFYLAGINDRKD
ncbi:MAG: class I SAM-dependent methyltransferase [Candidatus Omnitrophica bacterium]|nr:class I SAM-dependent methyltransferase [Candidatus Omnitrophota bacterium]